MGRWYSGNTCVARTVAGGSRRIRSVTRCRCASRRRALSASSTRRWRPACSRFRGAANCWSAQRRAIRSRCTTASGAAIRSSCDRCVAADGAMNSARCGVIQNSLVRCWSSQAPRCSRRGRSGACLVSGTASCATAVLGIRPSRHRRMRGQSRSTDSKMRWCRHCLQYRRIRCHIDSRCTACRTIAARGWTGA